MADYPKTYKIQEGDCLSLIAERFNLDVAQLQALNSDQIKDIDLIYAGNTLVLPGQEGAAFNNDPGTRIPLPKPPKCKNDYCGSSGPELVDILYVPAHPKSNKKVWYAISQDAKKIIEDEQKLVAESVIEDHEATLQKLNSLGLLSKFQNTPHEAFLESKTDIDRYRLMLYLLLTIKTGAAKQFEHGEDSFIESVATQEGLDVKELIDKYVMWEKVKGYLTYSLMVQTYGPGMTSVDMTIKQFEQISDTKNHLAKARMKLRHKVLQHLERERKEIERRAEQFARTLTTDDGSKFVYDKNHQYFTSSKQKNIEATLKAAFLGRTYHDTETALNSHEDASRSIRLFWDYVKRSSEKILSYEAESGDEYQGAAFDFAAHLLNLNRMGILLKEQCLTFAELEGEADNHLGPETLRQHFGMFDFWRSNEFLSGKSSRKIDIEDGQEIAEKLIQELGVQTDSKEPAQSQMKRIINTKGFVEWGYYPSLAIVKLIDATLSQWTGDLKKVLGSAMPAPQMFSHMIWVKKLALARIDFLKELAADRAKKAENLQRFYLPEDKKKAAYQLVWDEEKFKPQKKSRKLFHKKTGEADLQVVECVLLSSGEVGWVRGPAWYLPQSSGDESKARGHIKNITQKVVPVGPGTMVDSQKQALTKFSDLQSTMDNLNAVYKTAKSAAGDAANDLVKGKFALSVFNIAKEAKGETSAFWEDNYHWEDGFGPDGKSLYVVDAQAQFMRLSASVNGTVNLPASEHDKLKPNMDLTSGVSASVNLTLLSGQLSFKTWFPQGDQGDPTKGPAKGMQPDITYMAWDETQQKEVPKTYECGDFFLEMSAVVYGLAAATCSISGNVSFGPSATDGKIGVKGKATCYQDYNQGVNSRTLGYRVNGADQNIPESSAGDNGSDNGNPTGLALAGQGVAKVDAFAGVEAGGEIGAKVYWRPPATTINGNKITADLLELGGVTSKLAANAGIGFSGELRIAFQNGTLYLVAAAKVVCGPGVSGKISVSVNPINADRFIEHLLNILKESGFRRIAVFGEVDENGVNQDYEALNERLTLAIVLGLSFGDILLMPTTAYADFKSNALKKDYAPTVARNILERSDKQKVQSWVKNMPPESMCKLLDCLSQRASGWWESDDEEEQRKNQEIEKAQAIIQIMDWLTQSTKKEEILEQRRRQFEESLIRMGGNLENVRNPYAQWQRFAESWYQIAHFIDRLELTRSKERNSEIARIRRLFTGLSLQLCGNIRCYRLYTPSINKFVNRFMAYRVDKDSDNSDIVADRQRVKEMVEESKEYWKEFNWEL